MNERTSRARKLHKCEECGGYIPPGKTYHAITGKWDGEMSTYRLHLTCNKIAGEARTFLGNEADLCWDELPAIGELVERAREDADEGDYFPPYWPAGIWISRLALRKHAYSAEGIEV
jgi:hypothetical protein